MYRQILIHPDERHYQQIIWREDTMEQPQEFKLNTVTYGVKSSAYHALRVIKQLVKDEGAKFPLAANRITEDMYIDDLVSGANSICEAAQLVEELQQIFSRGGFSLSKWATTHQELIPITSRPTESVSIKSSEHDSVKILGLTWNSQDDAFSYSAKPIALTRITKRTMLSAIARIFDPLGLLAPIIFIAKSLIQELWKAKVGWDDELPHEIIIKWKALSSQWDHISAVRTPRNISFIQARFTLIGFCDASLKGYAATLYLRSDASCGDVRVALIKAKTKVAPDWSCVERYCSQNWSPPSHSLCLKQRFALLIRKWSLLGFRLQFTPYLSSKPIGHHKSKQSFPYTAGTMSDQRRTRRTLPLADVNPKL